MPTSRTVEPLLNEGQAAARLGLKPNTLAVWRVTGKYGLPFVKVGKCVRYKPHDLDVWIESRTVGSSSNAA